MTEYCSGVKRLRHSSSLCVTAKVSCFIVISPSGLVDGSRRQRKRSSGSLRRFDEADCYLRNLGLRRLAGRPKDKLRPGQPRKYPASRGKFIEGAALNDASLVENQYLVSMANCCKAVGNHEGRPPAHCIVERALEVSLGR